MFSEFFHAFVTNPLAAIAAGEGMAIVVLFWALVRSWRGHLADLKDQRVTDAKVLNFMADRYGPARRHHVTRKGAAVAVGLKAGAVGGEGGET